MVFGQYRGPLRRVAERILLKRVAARVDEELTTRGFALVSAELEAAGVTPTTLPTTFNRDQIAQMYVRAEIEGGLSDEAVIEYADSPAVAAFGDGKFLEIIRNIIEWLSDPANQAKILAIVKFVMMVLAMFGI